MPRALYLVLPLLLGLPSVSGPTSGADVGTSSAGPTTGALPAAGWAWPVVGPVLRDFDPPEDPYGAGHRGIDIAAPLGTAIRAPEAGTVSFAGKVGGQLFITLDHGGGLQSTYSWLSAALVRKGDAVARGGVIGRTGVGHPGLVPAHLHFGLRLGGAYVDPLEVLGPLPLPELIHLAPELGVANAA